MSILYSGQRTCSYTRYHLYFYNARSMAEKLIFIIIVIVQPGRIFNLKYHFIQVYV